MAILSQAIAPLIVLYRAIKAYELERLTGRAGKATTAYLRKRRRLAGPTGRLP